VVVIDHTRGNRVSLRWLLYDGHGNLVRLMAPDYTLSAFQWRGVWGEGQGSLGAGRGYCANLGHPEDETGLVYMRTRYYEPATGRFISEDPDRDGVNWYAYCESKPVIYVDPDGRQMTQEQRDVLANEMIRAGRSFIVSGFIAALSGAINSIRDCSTSRSYPNSYHASFSTCCNRYDCSGALRHGLQVLILCVLAGLP
jgi:RHS repeat-associated protein